MAFTAQNIGAERLVAKRTGASLAKASPVRQPILRAQTQRSKALISRAVSDRGAGNGDICDPPQVYQPGPDAQKVVKHVEGDNKGREFEAPRIEETVVQHDVERVQPVIHREVHQTRLHEATHHKTEAPRDRGITEVVQHRDADPCGGPVDVNAVSGPGFGNESDKVSARSQTDSTAASWENDSAPAKKPVTHGIKGAINELLPGSGPFKEKV